MRRHRARQTAETMFLRFKKEAIAALPEKLQAAAMVPDITPFPAYRYMATLTPPIEGYIEKVRDAAKKYSVKEKLRWVWFKEGGSLGCFLMFHFLYFAEFVLFWHVTIRVAINWHSCFAMLCHVILTEPVYLLLCNASWYHIMQNMQLKAICSPKMALVFS